MNQVATIEPLTAVAAAAPSAAGDAVASVLGRLAEVERVAAGLRATAETLMAGGEGEAAGVSRGSGSGMGRGLDWAMAVAHEGRNLITPAVAYLDQAARPDTPPDEVRRSVLRAREALLRAEGAAEAVLRVARRRRVPPTTGSSGSGRSVPRCARKRRGPVLNLLTADHELDSSWVGGGGGGGGCDVDREVASAVEVMTGLAGEAGVSLDLRSVETLRTSCDPDAVHAVLINLLHNAIRAGSRRIVVRVYAAERPEPLQDAEETTRDIGVAVDVEDDGCGLGEQTNPEQRGGVGIGLRYCCDALSAEGGMLWLQSAPGGGTLARLWLPPTEPVP